MEKEKSKKHAKEKMENIAEPNCNDRNCPIRGRSFKGYITKIHDKRIVVEFRRVIYRTKYERYEKAKTRLHAHLPSCMASKVKVGDYVLITECRPISKIKHHVLLSKVGEEK
jgi:small subunit ribosomal protein S17